MCSVMIHRGPDDEGYFIKENIGLGMRRLSIIDLEGGAQPISNNQKKIWIVLNGEIYNYLNLRNKLSNVGVTFKTKSDTEVMLKMYEHYGLDFVKHCNGMFAFAIYDENKNELIIGRDRIGKKPLFYTNSSKYFAFASEIKCLLVNDQSLRKINKNSIFEFINHNTISGDKTSFSNIMQLLPGTIMRINNNGIINTEKYWDLNYNISYNNLDNAIDDFHTLFDSCISDRLLADVPVGLLLSGGIDSCAIASKIKDKDISTYTIRFDDSWKDEGSFAKIMADQIGSKHNEIYFNVNDVFDLMPKLVWHYEQPFHDSSALPTFFINKLASKDVRVLLNGDGGDENFAGYWNHLLLSKIEKFTVLHNILKPTINGLDKIFFSKINSVFFKRISRWSKWLHNSMRSNAFEIAYFYNLKASSQLVT